MARVAEEHLGGLPQGHAAVCGHMPTFLVKRLS